MAPVSKDRSPLRQPIVWVGLAIGAPLLLLWIAWLARAAIASVILSQYCATRDLVCRATLDNVSVASIDIRSIQIGEESTPDALSIESVRAKLRWQGLQPRLAAVSIDSPKITLGFDGSRLDLNGLNRLAGNDSGGPAPNLNVSNGQLALITPAGTLTGNFEVSGSWPESLAAQLSIMPVAMQTDAASLDLDSAEFDIDVSETAVTGVAALNVNALEMGPTRIDAFRLNMDQPESTSEALRWSISAKRLAHGTQHISRLQAEGRMKPELLERSDAPIWSRLLPLQGSGRTQKIDAFGVQAEETEFIFDVANASGTDLDISAEVALLELAGLGLNASDLVWIYVGTADPISGKTAGRGQLIIDQASLSVDLSDQINSLFGANSPLAGHGKNLSRQVQRALQSFSTRLGYQLDTTRFSDWRLLVTETTVLRSDSGLLVTLAPGLSGPVLSANSADVTLRGVASVKGANGLDATADIQAFTASQTQLALDIGGVELSPWKVGETSLSARLNRFKLDAAANRVTAQILGEIGFDGEAYGWRLQNAKLFGGVDGQLNRLGWRLQTLESDCIGLGFEAAKGPNAVEIGNVSTAACPEAGRLAESGTGTTDGRLSFGDLSIPFSATRLNGTADLSKVTVGWRAGSELDLDVRTTEGFIDMSIAGRSLQIQSSKPSLRIVLDQSTRFDAKLGQTALSGDLIPAGVLIPDIAFQGRLRDRQFDGELLAETAIIQDQRTDPLFQPVRANVVAEFQNADLRGSADLFLDADDIPIGEADFDVNLVSLTGGASMQSRELSFAPAQLQPTQLSERLRGLLTNATGSLRANAYFAIERGTLSGEGQFEISDLSFDTLRLGRVSEVNGNVRFDDLLRLTTPPNQRVDVGRIEPGLALEDGDIRFQLRGAGEARLEKATWPFAGGTLNVLPVTWTIAGQSDTVIVEAIDIELEGLIETLQLPDLEAKGTVSGQLPIVFESGNVLIQDAQLVADETGGFLRYTGQSVSALETQDMRVDSAFQALRDFRFSVLELGIDGNLIGDLLLRLKLLGYNPDVLGGSEFSFNITIDSRFIDLVQAGRRALGTEWLAKATVNNRDEALAETPE